MVLTQFRVRKCYPEGIQEEQSLRMLVVRLLTFVLSRLSLPGSSSEDQLFYRLFIYLYLSGLA